MQSLGGSNKKPPNPLWPYFDDTHNLDPERIMRETEAFAAAIEEKPGGGYQWRPDAIERMQAINGNDNRQT